ncbi:hypothetical protein D3C81_2102240 [compost metagenome]|uniref:Uncharacterized protein n=1 Tax=Paenibacillus graminis TaxID=189425 RepID=A0A089M5B5_9BACL|nr:hypothetical protein [Paenibacillus graminis]AIQ66703.1 hypothetical protein PGRAT_02855 [Paenibacillus graminis]
MFAGTIAGALLPYALVVLPKAENPAMSHQQYVIVLTAAQVFQNGSLGFFAVWGGLALSSGAGMDTPLLRY